jgi:hypothetical protein
MYYKISYFKKDKDASPFLQFEEVDTMEESIEFVKLISKDHTVLEIKYYLDDEVKKPDRT